MRAIAKIIPLVGLILLLNSTPSLGAVKAGSKCSKINSNSIVGGYQYTCIKSGKELIWSKGKKVPLKVKPACTQNTIAALQGGARRVSINQSGAQAAWKNYLEFRFLYLENRYVNNSLYQSYLKQANLWYKTAFDNKNSADYLRREFNNLNGLCRGSKVTLPQPLVLNDPMNTPDDWPENPSFVEPDISVTFSKSGALLTCNKPWIKKWNSERVHLGYGFYSVGPTNFDMSKISENQMGGSMDYAFGYRSKNQMYQEGGLSLAYTEYFASGQEICGQVLSPPDIPEVLKREFRRDALSIGVWLIIKSPKPTRTTYDEEWWGKLLKIDLISNTPFTNVECSKSGRNCEVGNIGPGGGIVFYDAGSQQSWGRYLEFARSGWSGDSPDPVAQWCEKTSDLVGAWGTEIGTGKSNTDLMLARCTSGAAVEARAYRGGGKSDWYLPSVNEFNELCKFARYQATGDPNIGCNLRSVFESELWWQSIPELRGFLVPSVYWTSTESNNREANLSWFKDQGGNLLYAFADKVYPRSVRPVRAF